MEHIKKSFTGAHAYQSCTSPNLVFPINVVCGEAEKAEAEVANSSVWIPNLHHLQRQALESLTLNLQMESWAMQNSSKLWKLTYATTPFREDWISKVWNAKNSWLLAIDDKIEIWIIKETDMVTWICNTCLCAAFIKFSSKVMTVLWSHYMFYFHIFLQESASYPSSFFLDEKYLADSKFFHNFPDFIIDFSEVFHLIKY